MNVFWRRLTNVPDTAVASRAPVVFGVRRGHLRQWGWLLWLLVVTALGVLVGYLGLILGALLLVLRYLGLPPRYAAFVVFPSAYAPPACAPLADAPNNSTPCLWFDGQRVVLGAPYRVVYRDEMPPAEFARLRRLCLGLPA